MSWLVKVFVVKGDLLKGVLLFNTIKNRVYKRNDIAMKQEKGIKVTATKNKNPGDYCFT